MKKTILFIICAIIANSLVSSEQAAYTSQQKNVEKKISQHEENTRCAHIEHETKISDEHRRELN